MDRYAVTMAHLVKRRRCNTRVVSSSPVPNMNSIKKQVLTIGVFFILNQSLRSGILCTVHLIPGIVPSLFYTHRKGLALVSWLPSDHAAKEKNSYRLGF